MPKRLLPFFIAFFIIQHASAQKFNSHSLVGTWKVSKVIVSDGNLQIPKEAKQMMEDMKRAFLLTRFTFKSNGKFLVQLPANPPAFMKNLKAVNNKDWKYDQAAKLISVISAKEPSFNDMKMYVDIQGPKTFFVFTDAPVVLEVKKN